VTWWRRLWKGDGPESDFGELVERTEGGSVYAYESLARHLIATALTRDRPDDDEVGWLRGQDASTWRRIEAAPRDHRLYQDVYPPVRELQNALGADCSTLLAVMSSFHRSGYVRETAVDILAGRHDTLADKSLALRTSDWVDVVRQKARSAVLDRAERHHALSIVPLLVATLDQDRSQGFLDEYLSRLDAGSVGDLARFGSRATRRHFVNRLELPDEELMQRAIEDEDPLVRSRAAQTLLARRPDAAGELFVRASGVVRALALEDAPAEMVLERERALLLERRATVRRAAQRRLSQLGRAVADRYRDLVAAPAPTPTAIIGLGETGGREDEPRLVELLQHDDEAIRRAAMFASQWIMSEPVLMEIAVRALHDPSDLVVRAAARLLRRRASRIPKDVIEGAVASPSRSTHLAGLWLARRSDGWSRLEADLTLSTDPDEDVARVGRADLVSWVSRVAPTLYGSPPPDQLESIRSLLDRAQLEKSLERNIRFHCGIDC
jgi:HEAT repeat protein